MYFYVPAADVSVLPREMSRSDRGVRGREALSVSRTPPAGTKKETGEHSSTSKKRASDRNGDRRFHSPSGDVTQ